MCVCVFFLGATVGRVFFGKNPRFSQFVIDPPAKNASGRDLMAETLPFRGWMVKLQTPWPIDPWDFWYIYIPIMKKSWYWDVHGT